MTLGKRIVRLRNLRQWTQKGLGEKAGIHPNTVARLERDEIPKPSGELIVKLAKALEVSTDDLLLGQSEDEPNHRSIPHTRYAWEAARV